MTGDIRIDRVPELRERLKRACVEAAPEGEQYSYEEMLDRLLTFYEQHEREFEQLELERDRDGRRDRLR